MIFQPPQWWLEFEMENDVLFAPLKDKKGLTLGLGLKSSCK
jgi:hypothetical protein